MNISDTTSLNNNIPRKCKRILVFDTETTGLIPKNKTNITDFPYITQLSYIIYNVETKQIENIYNNYINIPQHIIISDLITTLTGITREICDEKGKNIIDVLINFYNAYIQCDYIIAHNWDFDSKILFTEYMRNNNAVKEQMPNMHTLFNRDVDKQFGIRHYCTMKTGIIIYRLNKYPKLSELHQKLFKSIPEKMHNSIIDAFVCLRCFLVMEYNYAITDNEFDMLLQKYR